MGPLSVPRLPVSTPFSPSSFFFLPSPPPFLRRPVCPVLAVGSSAALTGFMESPGGLSLGLERPLGLRLEELELPRGAGPSARGSSRLPAIPPGSLFHSASSRRHSLSGTPLRSPFGPLCVFPVTRFFESWLKMRSSFHFSGIWRA